MSLSDIKRTSRTILHERMAEPCSYEDADLLSTPSAEQSAAGLFLSARFASKTRVMSAESDAVSIMENVERLIFNEDQLELLGLILEHGGLVNFPGYGITFELDQEIDGDGPCNVYWTVVRAA